MNDEHSSSGPIETPVENWDEFKDRWNEVADIHDSGDVAGSVFLLRRLAAEGFSPAMSELGDKLEFGGGGINADWSEAVTWYQKSVEIVNDVRSHLGLARIYLQSKELDPDRSLSFYHLKTLADTDIVAGWFGLGILHQHGIGIDRDYEAAQRCFEKAIEKGHLMAGVHLSHVLLLSGQPGWLRIFFKFQPKIVFLKLFRTTDPRIGFAYEPLG